MINKIRDTIQDCNINFLIGSGLSSPFLKTLGNIEFLLTDLDRDNIKDEKKKIIRASLYKEYFDGVMSKNIDILDSAKASKNVLNSYIEFLKTINHIVLKRKSTILSKEINLFTTNIDIFLEKSLEDIGLKYNDGFDGRFSPTFSLNNFKISHFKRSLHYDNVSEIPTFNLLKLHGSLSWSHKVDGIDFSNNLTQVREIQDITTTDGLILEIKKDSTIKELLKEVGSKIPDKSIDGFLKTYGNLMIINPSKEKFKHTLLNRTYYELLRIYSNELEKENTVLFVMGFSFADEHIREVTLRGANSNPTLMIYIFAHDQKAKLDLEAKFESVSIKNKNLQIIAPPQVEDDNGSLVDSYIYDLKSITSEIFGKLFTDETDPEVLNAKNDE